MSNTNTTLQDVASVDDFLSTAVAETVPPSEHLELEFLLEYDVFAPTSRRRTRVHQPPGLLGGFLHCYYGDIYDTRPITREPHNDLVWYHCDLSELPPRGTVDRLLTDLKHVVDDAFDRLVEQATTHGLLDSTCSAGLTHAEIVQYSDAASWGYDLTAEGYYYGFGCTIVSTDSEIPITAEFTQSKQTDQETAMRVTRDVLATKTPVWMLGDSAYDLSDWYDRLLATGIVSVTPYNLRDIDDPFNIKYRVKNRTAERSEDMQLEQSVLEEAYNSRAGTGQTSDAVEDCGLEHIHVRGRAHARTEASLALYFRLVIAITNYERGNEPGCEIL